VGRYLRLHIKRNLGHIKILSLVIAMLLVVEFVLLLFQRSEAHLILSAQSGADSAGTPVLTPG
jgi:hypothetical protein